MLIWIIILLSVIMNAFYFGFVYARRIQNKLEYPMPEKQHLYCLGDGITYGVGVLRERHAFAWPYLLNVSLGSQWQVLNYGVMDATVSDAAKQAITRSDAFRKLAGQQDLTVLMMLGTNDSKLGNWHPMQFESDFNALLTQVMAFSKQCYLMTPPAVHPPRNGQKTAVRAEYVEEIAGTEKNCADKRVHVLDLYTETQKHPEWYTDDGVHLNRAGNEAVSAFVFRHISPDLRKASVKD